MAEPADTSDRRLRHADYEGLEESLARERQ